jgi:hypothetical protein
MPPRVPSGRPSMCLSCASRRRRIDDLRSAAGAVADAPAADLHGRRHIALHERRRHRERLGQVVEAFARPSAGSSERDVDVERQQVANGVRVLDAIEPMQRRRRQVRVRRQRLVETASSAAAKPSSTARSGAATRRRHQPGLQLEHDLLEASRRRRRLSSS